jgi:hypothetical protein
LYNSHYVDFISHDLDFDTFVCYIYSVLTNQQAKAVLLTDGICKGCEIVLNSPCKSCSLDPWPTFLIKENIDIILPSLY